MAKITNQNFTCRVNNHPSSYNIKTIKPYDYFNSEYKDTLDSPIDKFYSKINSLNILYELPSIHPNIVNGNLVPNFYNVLLLGYVSAVESYFREIIRQIINIDIIASQKCEELQISFGAAIHSTKELLPEALLENVTF